VNRTRAERTIERGAGEGLWIGDAIAVFVESCRGGRVRLVCRAPGRLSVGPAAVVSEVIAENGKAVLSRFPTVEDLMRAVEEEGRGTRRGSR